MKVTIMQLTIMQQIFEGTWEEVLLHADELVGQRVKLIVLTNQLAPSVTLDQMLQHRVGKVSFQPTNLSENTSRVFTDIVAKKHQEHNL